MTLVSVVLNTVQPTQISNDHIDGFPVFILLLVVVLRTSSSSVRS
jgi:hypothetical protein